MLTQQEFLDYFEWSNSDYEVNIPNEIFADLRKSDIKLLRHKAFAYSFYFLSTYLFKNVKYGSMPLDKLYSQSLLDLLSHRGRKYNYITKRKGELDKMGYTLSENNFPVSIVEEYGDLTDFIMYQDLSELEKRGFTVPSGFICKHPVKAFYRNKDSSIYDGTFFQSERTHIIGLPILAKCLQEEKYGFECFYVYGFLKAFQHMFLRKPIYKSYIEKSLTTSTKTLNSIISCLEGLGLLEVKSHSPFTFRIFKDSLVGTS